MVDQQTAPEGVFKAGDRVRWYHPPLCEGTVLKNNGGLCKVQWDTGEVRRDDPDKLRHADTRGDAAVRWRHVKRGTTYVEIGEADLQCEAPISDYGVVIVYRAEHDGRIWVRPKSEFEDGRFERIAPAVALAQPSAPPAGNQRPRTLIDQLEERFGPGSIAAWDGSDEKAIVGAAAPAGSDLLPGLEEVIRIINDHTLWRDVSSLVQAIRDCARAAGIEQPAASGTGPDKGEALRVALEALRPFADFARAGFFFRVPDGTPMTQGSRMAARQVTAREFKQALTAHDALRDALDDASRDGSEDGR